MYVTSRSSGWSTTFTCIPVTSRQYCRHSEWFMKSLCPWLHKSTCAWFASSNNWNPRSATFYTTRLNSGSNTTMIISCILGCPVVDHLVIITRIDNIGKLYGQRLTYLHNLQRVYCMQNYIKQVEAEAELRARQGFRGWARIRSRAETTDHSLKLASAIVCRWRRSGHVTRSSAWLIPHILLK